MGGSPVLWARSLNEFKLGLEAGTEQLGTVSKPAANEPAVTTGCRIVSLGKLAKIYQVHFQIFHMLI